MTPEERQASIEATATERAATLNPPVHHVSVADLHKRVAELEGKPVLGDPSNDFHLKGNALEEQHGKSRAVFIQKLVSNNLVEEASLPLFLKYLNEYEVDDSGDPPYDVEKLAHDGSGSERWPHTGWTETGDGTNYPGLPTQAQADAVVAKAQAERDARSGNATQEGFEDAAHESAGVDVRPSEEKVNG